MSFHRYSFIKTRMRPVCKAPAFAMLYLWFSATYRDLPFYTPPDST